MALFFCHFSQALVRVVLYVEGTSDAEFFVGFIEEFKERGQGSRLKYIGFDGGMSSLYEIRDMFKALGIKDNIWQGDGKTNCISAFYPDGRLRRAVFIRDSKNGFISKVYHWTIDLKIRMRSSLNLGVDGMITNDPEDLLDVIQEPYYAESFRLANINDDPFIKHEGKLAYF
ncbi:UNVERIFIED_CONTAM: Phospholipase D LsaSicTox-alphaIB2i [Trichonephila clavipes]